MFSFSKLEKYYILSQDIYFPHFQSDLYTCYFRNSKDTLKSAQAKAVFYSQAHIWGPVKYTSTLNSGTHIHTDCLSSSLRPCLQTIYSHAIVFPLQRNELHLQGIPLRVSTPPPSNMHDVTEEALELSSQLH